MLSAIESAIPRPARTLLRGVGQIYLQANGLTGIFILVGIAISSPSMAGLALAGATIGTITARICRFEDAEVESGMYGFNPSLVAMATFFYFGTSPISLLLMLVGSVIATFGTRLLSRVLPFPTFTSPYWLTSWTLYLLGPILGATWVQPTTGRVSYSFLETVALGVSQSLFQANVWTGVFCLIGVALSNWRHSLCVVVGSVVGIFVANYHVTAASRGLDPETLVERATSDNIMRGLSSYNAALPAIALFRASESFIPPLLGIMLSVPLTELVPKLGLPALNAPFVLATWFVLGLCLVDQRRR